jgi:hypothetical protein
MVVTPQRVLIESDGREVESLMRKNYVDSDSLSKKFDEVSVDLKVGGVSKLNDLVTAIRSFAKVSREPTCEALSQVLESFYNVVVSSGRALADPNISRDAREKLSGTMYRCVRDATHHVDKIGSEIKNGDYDSKTMLDAIGGVQVQSTALQVELKTLVPARGVKGTDEHDSLSS